ncbi:MAG: sigma-70 family RNA polymerase sigma factor [Actinomycetota bacterium]
MIGWVGAPALASAGGDNGGQPAPPGFDDFFRRERTAVVGLAYALSGSRVAAEDLAQDAFIAAYRRWDEIEQPAAWVRRVVANLAVSGFRRRAAEARAITRLRSERPRSFDPMPAEDEELWKAVRRLPKRQAQVIALRYLEDLSVAEIAAVLDTAEGTVKATLFQARRSLARALELTVEDADDDEGGAS